MTKNMGKSDKMIRVILAIILAALYYFEVVTGAYAWLLLLGAIVLLVTSLVNFCPAYTLFRINTCKMKE